MVEAFCATWKLVHSDNFDEYMKALGELASISCSVPDHCPGVWSDVSGSPDRCGLRHPAGGQRDQAHGGDPPGRGEAGDPDPEHLQEHRDLLQPGRGVWRGHRGRPQLQGRPTRTQPSLIQYCPLFQYALTLNYSLTLQTTVSLEGDQLIQVQKWDGKETKFVREIKDGKLVMVMIHQLRITMFSYLLTTIASVAWKNLICLLQLTFTFSHLGDFADTFIQSDLQPFIHTFTHWQRSQPHRATASLSGTVRVRCLAQWHLDTQLLVSNSYPSLSCQTYFSWFRTGDNCLAYDDIAGH